MSIFTGTGIWRAAGLLCCLWLLSPAGVLAQKKRERTPTVAVKERQGKADDLFFDAIKARMRGDDAEEDSLLQQFIRLKPEEPAGYFDLARLYFRTGRVGKAEEYIKKALALDEDNKWYREQYGNILAARNRFEEAAKVFERLAKDGPHNEEYLLLSSRLYQRAGKYREALAALDKLSAKTGVDEGILLQQQQIYLRMNDLASATAIIRQLIARNPAEPRYYGILAELYENNKMPAEAAEVYRQIQEKFPEDPGSQLTLALYYKKNKDEARYEEYVKKAITNHELDAETQISLLLPFLQELSEDSSRKDEAVDLAAQLATQHPDDAQVVGFYGDVLMLHGRRDQALEQYRKSLEINPARFNVWQQVLFSFTDRASADSLILYSEKAMTYFPTHALVHYLNGVGYFNKQQYAAAIKSLNRAVDLQPDDQPELLSDMYALMGDVYHIMKEHALSDSSYEQALKLAPQNATVLNNYAYYLSERGVRLEEAERMSRQSLSIRPGEPTFLDTYGWILYKQGKYDKAESYIRKAIETNPDQADGTLWDHLGDILYKRGQADNAVECWRKARERDSDNPLLDRKIKDKKLYE